MPRSSECQDRRFVIGPNASLSRRGAMWFMGSVGVVTLGSATGFALKGFWPVLPFAGLELVAVVTSRGEPYSGTCRAAEYGKIIYYEEGIKGPARPLGQGRHSGR